MKFYNRNTEIAKLLEISGKSGKNAQFTVVTGRRRIGKTQLLLNIPYKHPSLYFFVSRKAEPFLCRDFQQEIQEKLNIPLMGEINNFSKLFELLMEYSIKNSFTLIIDEFQDFLAINSSIYNEMQKHWDLLKNKSRINLIVCGSIYSIMYKIFTDYKAPLFGRATSFIQIHPFNVSVIKEILNELHPKNNAEDMLALYAFTGGVPK
jgi:AAA+ ATPase superfamily predicted ATPase